MITRQPEDKVLHDGPMSWEALAQFINRMSPEQRATDVTVYDPDLDEFFGASGLMETGDYTDTLDANHPFLVVNQ